MIYFSKEDEILIGKILTFAKARRVKLYIVGGYLRDLVLKRRKENPDIDFAVKSGAIRFGRALAAKIHAGFVVLDKERASCRLVKKFNDKVYTLDFTDFRGEGLSEDLLRRDFTINSLALDLEAGELIDLYAAKSDLKKKIIRLINDKSFDDDPLRILRAFSLSCIFGFKIEKKTLLLIKKKKNKLISVSSERIRDELFKILDSARAYDYFKAMDKLGVLSLIFPEADIMRHVNQGPYHHLDVFGHALETLKQAEIILKEKKNNKALQEYLAEVISSVHKCSGLIKLGAFLHDIGKPQVRRRFKGRTIFHGHERAGADITRSIARKLKLSNDQIDALNKMVFWHLRPGYMADPAVLSARAKFRFFRDTGKEAVSVLLVSLADQRATRGPLTSKESRERHEKVVSGLIKEYFKKQKEKKLEKLVNGNEIMQRLKLGPSPLIGKILVKIEEEQACGRLKTKAQAFVLAKKIEKAKI